MTGEPENLTVLCRSRWEHRPDREVPVEPGETLFDALRRGGIPVASSCRGGVVCGRCVLRVLEGAAGLSPAEEEEAKVLEREGAGAESRLACRTSLSAAGVVVTTSYW